MSTPRTIAVVTTSRADYGHLYWPLRELAARANVTPRLFVAGAHLSPEFGMTADVIERDGFTIARRIECLLSSDSDAAMAKTIGIATMGFADALAEERPDLLLVIADRYEMMAPACAALALRIPIVHIEGGERSEGAINHAVRNALTMMSHVHLTPTKQAAERVIAMGEEPWRVHQVGAPSLDHLRRTDLPDRTELERTLGMDLAQPPVVVGYHPVTLDRDPAATTTAVLEALDTVKQPIVFCFPNADAGSREIMSHAEQFCARRDDAHLHVNLEPRLYWGVLQHAAAMVGNSSSGIMESPSLKIPAVNIGDRQHGRERAANVIDVPPQTAAIRDALARALDPAFRASLNGLENPYGDGRAAERIAEVIASVELGEGLLRKQATGH